MTDQPADQDVRPAAQPGPSAPPVTVGLDPETKALLKQLLSRPPLTEGAIAQIERRLMPAIERAIMPKIERRLLELLVHAGIYPPEILDKWDRNQQKADGQPAAQDLGDRALGMVAAPHGAQEP